MCAEYSNGVQTRGEVEVDRGQSSGQFVKRIWLEPSAQIHPAVDAAIREFDAVLIGPGSFYTSLMPIFLVEGVRDALQQVRGPVVLISNLLTEGSGMNGFTAGDAVAPDRRDDRPADRRPRPECGGAVLGCARAIRRRSRNARSNWAHLPEETN